MPVMACMQPDSTLSAEEMACCKQMANDCGDMNDMGGGDSSGHDCCKTTEVRVAAAIAPSTSVTVGLDLNALQLNLPAEANGHDQVVSMLAIMVREHSPPESPPAFPQILRI
jgi:hypothetical protein